MGIYKTMKDDGDGCDQTLIDRSSGNYQLNQLVAGKNESGCKRKRESEYIYDRFIVQIKYCDTSIKTPFTIYRLH